MTSESEINDLQSEIEHVRKHRRAVSPAPDSAKEAQDAPATATQPGAPAAEGNQPARAAEDLLAQLETDIVRHPRLAVFAALMAGIVIGSLISR